MDGKVNRLVSCPEKRTVLLASRRAGTHEVDNLAQLSGLSQRVIVALCP